MHLRSSIALVLVVAMMSSPAAAAKGKKKGPKPYKTEPVTLAVAHPVFYTTTQMVLGVTAQEFIQTCEMPSSNGLDAVVWEVPKDYQGLEGALIRAIGAPGPTGAGYDLDMFLFDAGCEVQIPFQAGGTDESGSLLKDTRWILVGNYLAEPGVSVHLEFSPK